MSKSKLILPNQGMTMDDMIDDEQSQALRLQASLEAVNRRLLQTYETEQGLQHSLNNLYNMVEKQQKRLDALVKVLNVSEEQLQEHLQEQETAD